MICLEEIQYRTAEHEDMIALRNKILREPLGLVFLEEDLKKEKDDFLLGCYLRPYHDLIGCCVLTPISLDTLQLRQMSVRADWQKRGIGNAILDKAEKIAKREGFMYIYLHARKEATLFYQKYNYEIMGNEFVEVGIPHYEMKKQIRDGK